MITSEMGIEDVAAYVCSHLKKANLDAFLSGGAVVSIYTMNEYQSYDLDFVTVASFKKIEVVMLKLGFRREKSRHFTHPNSKIFVEFPGYAVSVGDSPIKQFAERKSKYGTLKLLTPTDCVKDRLAAFYHWDDKQGLDQAVKVAQNQPVDIQEIERWSKAEGMTDKYREFLALTTA